MVRERERESMLNYSAAILILDYSLQIVIYNIRSTLHQRKSTGNLPDCKQYGIDRSIWQRIVLMIFYFLLSFTTMSTPFICSNRISKDYNTIYLIII